MFAGLHQERRLDVIFMKNYDEMVLVRDITFTSMCEHHLFRLNRIEVRETDSSVVIYTREDVGRRQSIFAMERRQNA